MEAREKQLLLQIQASLPLVERPYLEIANRLGITEEEVIAQLKHLLAEGKVRRLGTVPNHYALGITANGMSVWDVPDKIATEVGQKMGCMPEVTHCYQRPRHLPDWPYNLFGMVHGRSREEVLQIVERIARDLDLVDVPHDIIFSTRLLKKTGTRLKAADASVAD